MYPPSIINYETKAYSPSTPHDEGESKKISNQGYSHLNLHGSNVQYFRDNPGSLEKLKAKLRKSLESQSNKE